MSNNYDSRYYEQNYGNEQREANQSRPVHQMSPEIDTTVTRTAILKLRSYSFLTVILGILAIILGAATLGFAAENIGFPVFNFGPLLVGIIILVGGVVGFRGTNKLTDNEITPEVLSSAKCAAIAVFVVSVTSISLAILSSVFAFLSGAICAGADIAVYSRNGNTRTRIDVNQYCSPNNTVNTVLGFLDGVVCIIIAIWAILGCTFFCCYGRYLGIKSRRRGLKVTGM